MDYSTIPTIVFSHPAIGTVGLTEEQAIKEYGQDQIKVYKIKLYVYVSACTSNRQETRFKLITAGSEEKVVGLLWNWTTVLMK